MEKNNSELRLITPSEMAEADSLAIEYGTIGEELMEKAGGCAAYAISQKYSPCPVVILCGPGNNGGDGFVIARHLAEKEFSVTVAIDKGDISAYKGDAAIMAEKYDGKVIPLASEIFSGKELVVDALFGTGLNSPVDGVFSEVVEEAVKQNIPTVAVDIPSGVNGASGLIQGVAICAELTITFASRKPGHVLFPGRELCGEVVLADIGIPDNILREVSGESFINNPDLWISDFPFPTFDKHKYDRGHAIVAGGPKERSGAARLAAHAALRVAGLATIICTDDALPIYAPALAAVMLHTVSSGNEIASYIAEGKKDSILIGPGYGVGAETCKIVLGILHTEVPVVLDADAITSFEGRAEDLFSAIKNRESPVVLTPHMGEFQRIFVGLSDNVDGKLAMAREATRQSGAVIALKGADTVIAAPDGRATVNVNAPAVLATAGSGDVLAGILTGLLAAGMDSFSATCAATWIHAECGNRFGQGLTADDFDSMLPEILQHMEFLR